MTAPSVNEKLGIVYTFYSFKGGVGRTMALANVAALLAKWGYSVLAVDWDLEAPGLEQFFSKLSPDIHRLRKEKPGIVDLMHAGANGSRLRWQDCLLDININGGNGRLSVLSAGRNDDKYSIGMQSLNFPELFDKHGLGSYIETLRNEWISEFDFVLIDSRTGVTDIGGICTVHLADVLVLLFTANDSSSDGALEIVERARKAQEHFPLDRRRLLAVPVPARDESRTEYERATQWKNKFAEQFGELYRDWLPSGKTPHDAIELLRIPYVPYWSFGEQLPSVEEGTSDPASLGHAYQILARILATRLDWFRALEGETLAPPPIPSPRKLDEEWLVRHRLAAVKGFVAAGLNGFMEIYHFCPDVVIDKSQRELLAAASQSTVHTLGRLIGQVVEDRPEARLKPTNEGIVASYATARTTVWGPGRMFDYWTLSKTGDFFSATSLPEDHLDSDREEHIFWFDTCITLATEALLHCANLYKSLGVDPGAHVRMTVRFKGLRGRKLGARPLAPYGVMVKGQTSLEDEVSTGVTFRLGAVESSLLATVQMFCDPVLVLFDFFTVPFYLYRDIVNDFLNGKSF